MLQNSSNKNYRKYGKNLKIRYSLSERLSPWFDVNRLTIGKVSSGWRMRYR